MALCEGMHSNALRLPRVASSVRFLVAVSFVSGAVAQPLDLWCQDENLQRACGTKSDVASYRYMTTCVNDSLRNGGYIALVTDLYRAENIPSICAAASPEQIRASILARGGQNSQALLEMTRQANFDPTRRYAAIAGTKLPIPPTLGLVPSPPAKTEPPIAAVEPALPQVKTAVIRARQTVASGSGFTISPYAVVTNYHVIDGCDEVLIQAGSMTTTANRQAVAPNSDLALLRTEKPIGLSASIRSTAALGEDVMAAGHPLAGVLADDLVVTAGHVNSLGGLRNDPTRFQFSAPVQSGNSGGPLFDRKGNVVGVVVSKLNVLKLERETGDIAQNINFAIKPEVLRLFLDTNRVSYLKATESSKSLTNVDLAERARSTTVQVICRR